MRVKKFGKQTIFLISEGLSICDMDYFYVSHAYWTKCLLHKIHCHMSCWKNITGKNYFYPFSWCLSNRKSVVYSYSLDNLYVSLYYSTKYLRYCPMVQNFWIILKSPTLQFVQQYLSNQCPIWKYCPKFIWQSLCVSFIWVKCPLYWQYVQLDLVPHDLSDQPWLDLT